MLALLLTSSVTLSQIINLSEFLCFYLQKQRNRYQFIWTAERAHTCGVSGTERVFASLPFPKCPGLWPETNQGAGVMLITQALNGPGCCNKGIEIFDFAIRVVSMISKIARPHLPADHTFSFSEHSLLWLLRVPSTAAQFSQGPGTCQGTEFSHMGLNKDLATES